MSTALRLRRGTTAEHAAFTGLAGEVTFDTTTKTLRVHDGSTASGLSVAGTPAWSDITGKPAAVTGTTASFTTAQETKLAGIATAATANSADATLLARANHSGSQAASTISDFAEATDDRVAALCVAGSNMTITYNDVAGSLTFAAAAGAPAYSAITSIPAAIDAIDGLTPAADRLAYYTGGSAAALATFTAAGRALVDDADASAQRTTLGLGGAAVVNIGAGAGTAAAGDHTHADLHTRSHAMTSASDHTAGNWKAFYSNGSGAMVELALGSSGQVLQSNGATSAPTFVTPSSGGATNLTYTAATRVVASDTGTDATLTLADGTNPGLMTSAEFTKLAGVAASANNYAHPNHSGDVTSVADGATTIAADAVTNAKLANVATATIKGRVTAATGDPEDLTSTQARTILNVADGATANSADAILLARANHTGTQAVGTITGLGNSATLDTGTAGGTVALGDHTHSDLHARSHAITSTSDHSAGNWKVFHSNGSGQVTELELGASGQVLQSNGASAAPTFVTPAAGGGGGPPTLFKALSAAENAQNVNTDQPWFPTDGAVTVEAGVYLFRGMLLLDMGTVSCSVRCNFGGTATVSTGAWSGQGGRLANGGSSGSQQITRSSNVTASRQVTAANTTAGAAIAIQGVVRFTGAGTFIPQFQFSAAPGGTNVVQSESFFTMNKLDDTSSATTRGTWA